MHTKMKKLAGLTALLISTQAVAFGPQALASRITSGVSLQDGTLSRRSWFVKTANAAIAISGAVALPIPAVAAEKFETYQNDALGFHISIPAGWEKIIQQLPDRRSITLFIDPTSGEDKTLMFIAKTPIQPDFTSLASFGSVDQVRLSTSNNRGLLCDKRAYSEHSLFLPFVLQVAQTTILPKGEILGDTTGTKSVMLSAESKKNAYYFDYKVTPPNLPEVRQPRVKTQSFHVRTNPLFDPFRLTTE